MSFHIAIDGPVAAGKGTVSRLVAERLGFLYIDTGAMYRMTAYLAKQHGVNLDDEAGLVALINSSDMNMRAPTQAEKDGRLATILLNGDDVSWKIRTEEVSKSTSQVAILAQVRAALVQKQQAIAQNKDVVMEGRDITYRVLPQAQLKIYLTASESVRAQRRHLQLQSKGEDVSLATVFADLVARDQLDMTRDTDPLKIIPEAWVLDTSELSIDEAVELIVGKVAGLQTYGQNT